MIFNEAEDFEIWEAGRRIGRFMVNSQEPYEINIEEAIAHYDGDAVLTVNNLLKSGAIVEYEPNYTVKVSLFGDVNVERNEAGWPDQDA